MNTSPENTPPVFEFPYVDNALEAGFQRLLVEQLRMLEYEHQAYGARARACNYEGPGQLMKRGYVQFGHAYEHNGSKRAAAPPMPAYLHELLQHGEQALSLPPSTFNQAVVMHYPVGTGVEWHTDGDRFGPCILGVSLGAPGLLRFRPRGQDAASHEVHLAPGSLYVLRGDTRWRYQHMLHPVAGERWSITFRSIAH